METKRDREKQPPLLLIAHRSCIDQNQEHSLYNVLENRCDTIEIPILSHKETVPCNYGWFALLNPLTNNCSLWNPQYGEMIRLPDLPNSCIYNKCVLSRPPTEPGCHILFNSACKHEQAFCQIGDDAFVEMSTEEDVGCIHTFISFRGTIYVLVGFGFELRLMMISFVDKTLKFRPILESGHPWHISLLLRHWSLDQKYYLTCDDDELLLVCKMRPPYSPNQFCEFRIFRIDIDKFECREIVNIGERTIFLSNTGDAFCRSSVGMKSNSIYYTDIGRNLYLYNLGRRTITTLLPCPAADRVMSATSWIEHRFP